MLEVKQEVYAKQEIKLHEDSYEYIKNTFGQYTQVDKVDNPLKLDKCILHLYPIEDTIEGNDNLKGYHDSLLFKLVIYDPINLYKYKAYTNHDAIHLQCLDCKIKYFKDLSTMIVIEEPVKINWQSQLVNIEGG